MSTFRLNPTPPSPAAQRATRALRLASLRLRATTALAALWAELHHDTASGVKDDAAQAIEAALATLDEWAETDPRGG